MSDAYTLFAEGSIGHDSAQINDYMALLKQTIATHSKTVMADKHIVGGPNFRRALRSNEHGNYLRELISDKKLCAAMLDGMWQEDGGIQHFTFMQFQRWYNRFNLWGDVPREPYMTMNNATREELAFFDKTFEKRFTNSRNRDPVFVQKLLEDLGNPILIKGLGEYHEPFKRIAREVYDDGSTDGIIRVEPRDHEDVGDRNISNRFRDLLAKEKVPAGRASDMLALVRDFGRATLASIESRLVGGEPILSPDQARWKEIMDHATGNALVPGDPSGIRHPLSRPLVP